MDEKKFQAIFKTGRDHMIQCRDCSVKSGPVREGEGVEAWCEAHVCGQDEQVEKTEPTPPAIPDPAKDDQGTGDPDSADTENTPVELTREGLEAMTKKEIMKGFAPEWDGTKADLIDFLLGENQEEEEENDED